MNSRERYCELAGKVYLLEDIGTVQGQQAITRYHFWDSDGVADPAVLVSDYIAHVLPALKALQSNQTRHTQIVTREVYPSLLLQTDTAVSPVVVGTRTSNLINTVMTLSLKWVIGATTNPDGGAVGSHIKRGGKHLPGPTQDMQDGVGNYNNSADSLVADYFASFAALESDNWQLVVAHAPSRSPVTMVAPVTGVVINGLSTQVSRKLGRGA